MYYCYENGPTGVQSRRVKSLVCTLQTSTSRALLQMPRKLMHFLCCCCRRRCRRRTLHRHLPRLSFAMIKRKNLTPKKMGSNVFQGHNSNCDNELLDIGEGREGETQTYYIERALICHLTTLPVTTTTYQQDQVYGVGGTATGVITVAMEASAVQYMIITMMTHTTYAKSC